jgi:hypothetical protein
MSALAPQADVKVVIDQFRADFVAEVGCWFLRTVIPSL